jgi:hypothetical protein
MQREKNWRGISGSQGGEYEDDSLLGQCVPPSSGRFIARTSEMLVNFDDTTQRYIPESCDPQNN